MVLSLSDPIVVYGIIVIIGVILMGITALYLNKIRKTGSFLFRKNGQRAARFDYQPETHPIPVVPLKNIPHPVRPAMIKSLEPLPVHGEKNLLSDRSDITESLIALVVKYSLEGFTIATSDGLVFASSGAQSATEDAAQYGEMYTSGSFADTPGVVLSGISHEGSNLILIIRTSLPVPEENRRNIEKDTKDILNWWV
jgi:hypothetical protein